jgi:glycerol kinase
MLDSIRQSAQAALEDAKIQWSDVSALGLANQGETVIAFDAHSGRPVCPAISWQDRRGSDYVDRWRKQYGEDQVAAVSANHQPADRRLGCRRH